MSTELTLSNDLNFEQMQVAANTIAKSGLFKAWDTTEKVMTLMLLCRAEGSDPLSAVNRYDMVQGRITKRSQAMLDDFIRGGGKVTWLESTEQVAKGKFIAPNGAEHTETFSIEDARRAGLTGKDNWKNYAKVMLRNRCVAFALRAVYPSVTSLMLTENEAVDISESEVQQKVIEGCSKTEKVLNILKSAEVKYEDENSTGIKDEIIIEDDDKKLATNSQVRMLFTKLHSVGKTSSELQKFIQSNFNKESTKQLTNENVDLILAWLNGEDLLIKTP